MLPFPLLAAWLSPTNCSRLVAHGAIDADARPSIGRLATPAHATHLHNPGPMRINQQRGGHTTSATGQPHSTRSEEPSLDPPLRRTVAATMDSKFAHRGIQLQPLALFHAPSNPSSSVATCRRSRSWPRTRFKRRWRALKSTPFHFHQSYREESITRETELERGVSSQAKDGRV